MGLAFVSALAFAVPAAAQIVNGTNSTDKPLPEAPIGTKAGGSDASLQAPGEGAAVAGALQNNAEAKAMQPLPNNAVMNGSGKVVARDSDRDSSGDH
jgi:hypothetical protein